MHTIMRNSSESEEEKKTNHSLNDNVNETIGRAAFHRQNDSKFPGKRAFEASKPTHSRSARKDRYRERGRERERQ